VALPHIILANRIFKIKPAIFKRFSKKNFAENKLSPSLFSLSPLFKFHPSFLQQTPVQPSNLFVLGIPPEFE